ncbi:MAG: hypothetical protein WC485_09725, partial [Opitutaceae bacterium]
MPNVIAADKRSVTYLENLDVLAWMEGEARLRRTTLAVILREATSAYYVRHRQAPAAPDLLAQRSAAKAAQRAETARRIAAGELTPEAAQARNAPIAQPVRVL